jgi:hypothetical protein
MAVCPLIFLGKKSKSNKFVTSCSETMVSIVPKYVQTQAISNISF